MTYQVIVADPPWMYSNRKTGGERKNKTKFGGGAQKHYPLMPDADLIAMRPMLDSLADKNSILFMWATCPRLDFAIQLMAAWGFRFVTVTFAWVKPAQTPGAIFDLLEYKLSGKKPWVQPSDMDDHMDNLKGKSIWKYGPGFYTASNLEVVIAGVRGSMPPTKKMVGSVIMKPVGRHSAKPEDVMARIEAMYPAARKIELFIPGS